MRPTDSKPNHEPDDGRCSSELIVALGEFITHRAPMNIPIECAAVCSAAPTSTIAAPMMIVCLRPMPSDRYGANGKAAILPIFWRSMHSVKVPSR